MPEFNVVYPGYDPHDVKAYIDKIWAEHSKLQLVCRYYQARIRELEDAVVVMRDSAGAAALAMRDRPEPIGAVGNHAGYAAAAVGDRPEYAAAVEDRSEFAEGIAHDSTGAVDGSEGRRQELQYRDPVSRCNEPLTFPWDYETEEAEESAAREPELTVISRRKRSENQHRSASYEPYMDDYEHGELSQRGELGQRGERGESGERDERRQVARVSKDACPETTDESDPHENRRKRIWESKTTGFLFYTGLIIVILVLFLTFSEKDGVPRSLLGFSLMTVLTPSMQNEIPKDSLVITREVDAATLQIGDDITFLVNEKTTMTHRIVGIYENYLNTGMRGFETKGTMNPSPDREIVSAQNVIGKVVFHNLILGQALGFVKKYALWIGIFTPLCMGLFVAMRVALSKDGPAEREQRQAPSPRFQSA